jgi:hypothetical protein
MVHLATPQSTVHQCTRHFLRHCTVRHLFSMPAKQHVVRTYSTTWCDNWQVLLQHIATQFKHLLHTEKIPTARWTITSLPTHLPTTYISTHSLTHYLPTYPPTHLPTQPPFNPHNYKSMQLSPSFANICMYSINSSHSIQPKGTSPPRHIIYSTLHHTIPLYRYALSAPTVTASATHPNATAAGSYHNEIIKEHQL